MMTTAPATRLTPWSAAASSESQSRLWALVGACAIAISMAHNEIAGSMAFGDAGAGREEADAAQPEPRARTGARTVMVGGYGGLSDTMDSTITIRNAADGTDMTVRGFEWIGMPFKSPIYYGLRAVAWQPDGRLGGMVDFTHAKAIARASDVAQFAGTRRGEPVAPSAKIGDVFRHMEFSHGHNMVTLNGLVSFASASARLRPYAGLGAGVSLPHTEVGFRNENARTYEYQFAGFVGQALAGVEIRLGRASIFLEYKFSYAPYSVPLSHEPRGHLLVTDLWRQAKAAIAGETPPGGWLTTPLLTHHGIGGVLVRISGAPNS